MRILPFALSTGLALVACRSDSPSTIDGNGSGDSGNGGAVKIQMVQNDAMAPGTAVSLHGVVVTAIDNFGAKVGDFWVEEPEGGEFSGVHIFKATPSQVSPLMLGDIVDITGAVKSEFALTSDTSGRTVTELEPPMGGTINVTKTGSGTPLTPHVVDALAIGQMADPARSAEWEKWEGVLITVNNANVIGNLKQIGGATPDPTLQSIAITGVAKLESSLAAFPANIQRNDCLASATGVLDYFFDYLLLPRTTAEVSTGGTGCPAPENSPQLCENSTDDDGNGFTDCADLNCIVGDNTCRAGSTISAIDMATTLPTGGIEIGSVENVYVTAISSGGKNFWVSKLPGTGQAAANQGLYVFTGAGMVPGTLAVKAKVDIIGTVSGFNNDATGNALTEFDQLQVTVSGAAAAALLPVTGQMASTLTTDAGGKPLIGSLITLTNVAVVTAGTAANHGTGSLKQAGVTFESLADIIGMTGLPASEVGKCYASITGIWTYDVFNNMYGLIPTGVGTGVGACT
ncbi:MAG: hypothetical protein JWO36_4238 [Myxococcales bacterium]|nr:hypothetical protein [Myxococcales bacterium]